MSGDRGCAVKRWNARMRRWERDEPPQAPVQLSRATLVELEEEHPAVVRVSVEQLEARERELVRQLHEVRQELQGRRDG